MLCQAPAAMWCDALNNTNRETRESRPTESPTNDWAGVAAANNKAHWPQTNSVKTIVERCTPNCACTMDQESCSIQSLHSSVVLVADIAPTSEKNSPIERKTPMEQWCCWLCDERNHLGLDITWRKRPKWNSTSGCEMTQEWNSSFFQQVQIMYHQCATRQWKGCRAPSWNRCSVCAVCRTPSLKCCERYHKSKHFLWFVYLFGHKKRFVAHILGPKWCDVHIFL